DFVGFMLQSDLTWRFAAFGADHKVLTGIESTHAQTDRLQRRLAIAERSLYLPATVRSFDPYEPDYYRPAYSPDLYKRAVTDRDEEVLYSALVVNTRSALHGGRTVFTTGIRQE